MGPLATAVAIWVGLSAGGGGGAGVGRGLSELNIWVNSPGPVPDGAGGGTGLPGVYPAAGRDSTGSGANGSAGVLPLSGAASKALRNIAVALRESGCSGGSGPDFGSFFGMRMVLFGSQAGLLRRLHARSSGVKSKGPGAPGAPFRWSVTNTAAAHYITIVNSTELRFSTRSFQLVYYRLRYALSGLRKSLAGSMCSRAGRDVVHAAFLGYSLDSPENNQ